MRTKGAFINNNTWRPGRQTIIISQLSIPKGFKKGSLTYSVYDLLQGYVLEGQYPFISLRDPNNLYNLFLLKRIFC